MKAFHRLHALRMENDAHKFAMEEMRGRFETMKHRHENGTAPRAIAVHQLFQTPPAIAADMAALLAVKPGARVLEPSAGLGRLLDAVEPYEPSEVVAVEVAADCARELYQQNRKGVRILQRDFLTVEPSLFDAVIMNPPFTMRSDVEHITHALRFLKPGGRLVALALDTWHRAAALKDRASEWRKLPANSFKETGTRVDVVLMVIEL